MPATEPQPAPATPLLTMRGVHKRFGAVVALGGVDLVVHPGEVLALVGENGAGKSTLMKILSGALAPDGGTMTLQGADFAPRDPLAARAGGVAMIYQELNLAPDLTVEQNVMLGREARRFGFVQRASMRPAVQEALAFLNRPDILPTTRVAALGPAARQIVEIARALVGEAKVVVMDEPTSSLARDDADTLLALVRRLRDRGVSVIYISHFLEEVQRVAERYTVLRDGSTVATGDMAGTTIPALVEAMVGRPVDQLFPRVPHTPGDAVLTLQGVAGAPLPRAADLVLRRGEILGIGGLVGSGRTELLRAVFGLAPVRAGTVRVGAMTDGGAPPWVRLRQGVGLLSEDRKEEGLALGLSVADNIVLSHPGPVSRGGWLRTADKRQTAARWIDQLGIRCRAPDQRVGELSGGNQQKVALARLLHHDVDVLLLDEPTRGVDVASKVEIYRLVGELAAAGKSVLFVSSHIPELLGVCDRVAVMHRGTLGEARPVAEWSENRILEEAARGAA
jgi:ribose transport system ATP-binding protein